MTLVVVALAYWCISMSVTGPDPHAGFARIVDALFSHDAFAAAAWIIIAARVRSDPGAQLGRGVSTTWHVASCLGICVICLATARQATAVALLLLALDVSRSAKAVAALLAALAGELLWISTALAPVHEVAATADALIVKHGLGLLGIAAEAQANIVAHRDDAFSLEVLSPCASSFPLASVCLAFLVTFVYRGRLPNRRDLPWLAASLLTSVVLTEIRLSYMALGEAEYIWAHDGGGGTLYSLAAAAAAALFPLLATTPSTRSALA